MNPDEEPDYFLWPILFITDSDDKILYRSAYGYFNATEPTFMENLGK